MSPEGDKRYEDRGKTHDWKLYKDFNAGIEQMIDKTHTVSYTKSLGRHAGNRSINDK